MLSDHTVSILIFAGIDVIMALSFYLPASAGQLSAGQGGFMALGAYTAAYLSVQYGVPFPVALAAGRVRVNGAPGELNTVVGSRDIVEVDGRPVELQALAYVLLHKPVGVVTTARDPQGRPTVVGLVSHPARVVPVRQAVVSPRSCAHRRSRATASRRSTAPSRRWRA